MKTKKNLKLLKLKVKNYMKTRKYFKLLKLKVKNYKILQDVEICFNSSLTVIAGVNGVGKTSILELIYLKGFNKLSFSDSELNIIQDEKKVASLNFSEFHGRFDDYIKYLKAEDHNTQYLKESILRFIDKLIYEDELSPKYAYLKFDNMLNSIFQDMDINIKFQGLDRDKNIFFTNSLNHKVKIDNLSTGERELLNKILMFFISDIRDTIILIDEPEISLHPSWQNRVVKLYQNIAEKFNNQIVIATHSPNIIASTPKESLRVLVKENGKIVVKNLNSYGMNINQVLTSVMGIENLRDIEVEKQIDKIREYIFENRLYSNEFKKEFAILENMLENDSIELGLLKFEINKRMKC